MPFSFHRATQNKGKTAVNGATDGSSSSQSTTPVVAEHPWSYLLSSAVVGALIIAFYPFWSTYQQVAFALAIAAAAMFIGILLGFLFGVPHTIQSNNSGTAKDATMPTQTGGVQYKPSTALEQISDWLTKILVGVGLTQLTTVPAKLGMLGKFLARGLGGSDAAAAFGVLVFMFFSICGFLVGFLWTRLYLQKEFRAADDVLLATIARIQSQPEKDAKALTLALQQLSCSVDARHPDPKVLADAIRDASPVARLQIFEQARRTRKDGKCVAETIPVFQALIEVDEAKQYHRGYGQLGYALKEKTPPDLKGAVEALTQAIKIRDDNHVAGYTLYELNRALCNMELDKAQPSDALKFSILADIKKVLAENPGLLAKESTIRNWLTANDSWLKANKLQVVS
jgi:hypothetical protein